jgi:hypothetical protein
MIGPVPKNLFHGTAAISLYRAICQGTSVSSVNRMPVAAREEYFARHLTTMPKTGGSVEFRRSADATLSAFDRYGPCYPTTSEDNKICLAEYFAVSQDFAQNWTGTVSENWLELCSQRTRRIGIWKLDPLFDPFLGEFRGFIEKTFSGSIVKFVTPGVVLVFDGEHLARLNLLSDRLLPGSEAFYAKALPLSALRGIFIFEPYGASVVGESKITDLYSQGESLLPELELNSFFLHPSFQQRPMNSNDLISVFRRVVQYAI